MKKTAVFGLGLLTLIILVAMFNVLAQNYDYIPIIDPGGEFTVKIYSPIENQEFEKDLKIRFVGKTENPNEGAELTWNFGNGIEKNGAIVEYTYNKTGDFTVTLTGSHEGKSVKDTIKIKIIEGDEKTKPAKQFELRFTEIQKPIGSTIKSFNPKKVETDNNISTQQTFLFENPQEFVLKLEGIDVEQNLWLSTGKANCNEIQKGVGGVINLQAPTESGIWAEKAGKVVYDGSVWAGRTLKTTYEYTQAGLEDVWATIKVIPSGFIKGWSNESKAEFKNQIKIEVVEIAVNGKNEIRNEIPLNPELNKPYNYENGKGLNETMFWRIGKIDDKKIKEIKTGKKITFFSCQKTIDNKLRETKLEIQFGNKDTIEPSVELPVAAGKCTSITRCMALTGQIFAQNLFK